MGLRLLLGGRASLPRVRLRPAPAGAPGRRRAAHAPHPARLGRWWCCPSTIRCGWPRTTPWWTCSRAAGSTWAWARAISRTSTRASAWTRRTSARASTRRSRSCCARVDGRSASPTRDAITRCRTCASTSRPCSSRGRRCGWPPSAPTAAPASARAGCRPCSSLTPPRRRRPRWRRGSAAYRAAFVARRRARRRGHRALRAPRLLRR